MAYMIAAYLVIWLVSFVLIFSMVQRQRTLQRDLDMLRSIAKDENRQ
jgi:CcmD family protein